MEIKEEKGYGSLTRRELLKYRRIGLFLAKVHEKEFVYNGYTKIRENKFILQSGETCSIDLNSRTSKGSIQALENYEQGISDDIPSNLYFVVDINGSKKVVPLGAFRKTEEFGGGNGGAAGGTIQTNLIEAGQCVVNALMQKLGTEISFSDQIDFYEDLHCSLKPGYSPYNVWSELQKVPEFWQQTILTTGKLLIEKFGKEGYWHWKDSFMNSINTTYSKFKDSKLKGSVERWNPADIWYTKGPQSSLEDNIQNQPDCRAFTEIMDTLCLKQEVVGISLKKLEGEGQVVLINPKEKSRNFEIVNSSVSEEIREGAATLNIEARDNADVLWTLAIGQRNTYPDLRVRIKHGKSAMHGSCVQGIIEDCLMQVYNLSKVELEKFQPKAHLPEAQRYQAKHTLNHQDMYDADTVKRAEAHLNGQYPTEQLNESLDRFFFENQSAGEMAAAKLACRMALEELRDFLRENGKEKLNEFAKEILSYGLSIRHGEEGPVSAIHYKVS